VLHRRVNVILSVVMNMQYIKLSRCTSSLTSSSQSLPQLGAYKHRHSGEATRS